MRKILVCAFLVSACVINAQTISSGVQRVANDPLVPGRTFTITTVDSAVALPSAYLNAKSRNAYFSVQNNPVRVAWNSLPSWANMVVDTANGAAPITDISAFIPGYGIRVRATGHSILAGMQVKVDSLPRYQRALGYRVAYVEVGHIALEIPDVDTILLDTVRAGGSIRTLEHGHVLPEGLVGIALENYSQLSTAYFCNADSGRSSRLSITVHDRE